MRDFLFLALFFVPLTCLQAVNDTARLLRLFELDKEAITEAKNLSKSDKAEIILWLQKFGTSDPSFKVGTEFDRYFPFRALKVLQALSWETEVDLNYLEKVINGADTKRSREALSFLPEKMERSSQIVSSFLLKRPGIVSEGAALETLRRVNNGKILFYLEKYLKMKETIAIGSKGILSSTVLIEESVHAQKWVSEILEKEKDPKEQLDILFAIAKSSKFHLPLWLGKIDKYIPDPVSEKRYLEWLVDAAKEYGDNLTEDEKHLILALGIPLATNREEPRFLFSFVDLINKLETKNENYLPVLGATLGKWNGYYDEFLLQSIAKIKTPESQEILKKYLYKPLDLPKPPFSYDVTSLLSKRAKATSELVDSSKEAIEYLASLMANAYHVYGSETALEDKKDSTGNREHLAESYETVRKQLKNNKQKQFFDEQLISQIFTKKNETEVSTCIAVCKLASQVESWARKDMIDKPEFWKEEYPTEPHAFALATLGAYFLSKAAPYCPDANKFFLDLTKNMFKKQDASRVPSGLKGIRSLAEKVRKLNEGRLPGDKWTVYGKAFYLSLLQEMKKIEKREGLSLEEIENEIMKTQDSLAKDLSGKPLPLSGVAGSVFETFTLSSIGLLMDSPPNELKEVLLQILKKTLEANPDMPTEQAAQYLPYGPEHPIKESKRAASARVIPFHLNLYAREPRESSLKEKYRKNLIAALESYSEHSGSLMMHIFRNNTHTPTRGHDYDAIAPYYYYPATAFVGSAIRLLEEDKNLSDEDSAKIKNIENKAKNKLLLLLKDDGLFLEQGKERFASSPAYVNPLAGLALLSFSTDCLKEGQAKSFGITDRETMVTPFQKAPVTKPKQNLENHAPVLKR